MTLASEDRYRALAEAARDRTATPRQLAEFVARYLEVAPSKIDPDDVVDPAAIALLEWAKLNPTEWWRSVHARLLPSQSELQQDQESSVSSRRLDATIATAQRGFRENEERRVNAILARARAPG